MSEDEDDKKDEFAFRRVVPQSDLDFNLMTTEPEWGKSTSEVLQSSGVLSKLWSVLSFYTKDQRLANLDRFVELPQVRQLNSLAGDMVFSDMPQASAVAIHKSANILETSQSKNGFLRRRMNTFTQEQFKTEMEPPKKSLFGGNKNVEVR